MNCKKITICIVFLICIQIVFGIGGKTAHSNDDDDVDEMMMNSDEDDDDFSQFDLDDDYNNNNNKEQGAGIHGKSKEQQRAKFNDDFKVIDDDDENDYKNNNDDDDDDGLVEEENDFEHFHDEEQFEGFNNNNGNGNGGGAAGDQSQNSPNVDQKTGEPKLTITDVPLHFRTHWDSFWMEMLMIAGLMTYFANYFIGKTKNTNLANKWLATHKTLLEENFTLVGDDGKLENECPGLMKESESVYMLWCSGRTCCEGMLVELKMIKRQDLVAVIANIMKPSVDQIHIKVEIAKDSMDSFIFCIGSRRTITKYFKELYDLNKYCILVNKPEEKYNIPSGFSILSEIAEATSTILDSRLQAALTKFQHLIDYIHITDQYNGVLQQEDPSNINQPEVKKMLLAGFNIGKKNINDMESVKPLLILVFYLLERLKRFRLSREGKGKADKNRLRVEEEFLKSTVSVRAEAAAARREEKRKIEKERVMADDDPEKQRRWEKKEQKRQLKKKAPKMKQLSIKAL